MNTEDIFYKAMLARDHRFDGKFFVGVKTTGIYCRPICPARPKRENIEFFATRDLAEKAGYRPCLRCRPEVSPDSPAWTGTSAIVQRALKKIRNNEALGLNEDQFAESLGVGARHLRRLFMEKVGKTPKQIVFENRLNLSRRLLTETALPVTEIAYASGFQSIRRFNDSFKRCFKKQPSHFRKHASQRKKVRSSMEKIQYEMNSTVGKLYLVASDDGLHGLFFRKQNVPVVTSLNPSNLQHKVLSETIRQLEEYFTGRRKSFDLACHLAGSPFQKQVWAALSKIPFGKTISYKDLARNINNPKAVRAVGSANGRNPICIIVPCHRVIASDGSLGGYAGGLSNKQQLLKIEGIDV